MRTMAAYVEDCFEEMREASIYEKQVKKSGLLSGGGLGFTIGKEQKKDRYDSADRTQAGSTIGSLTGNVTIHAGEEATVKASNVIAGKDITITGKEVTITSADDTYHAGESHEYKRSGLSVSLGGGAVDAAAGIASTVQRGTEVQDERLAALYGYETYEEGKKIYDAAQKGKLGKDSLHVNIGIGSSSMKYEAQSDSTVARGSQVAAGGDVTMKSENDLTVHGSTVAGQNVTLEAGKDISITAAENTVTNRTDSSSHSAGAGVSLSTQGVGVYGYANAGKGVENGTVITHTGSEVTASDTLTMTSGKDTDITGSKVSGEKAEANVGGNLNIESQQDQNNYVSQNKQTGVGVSISGGMTTVSGGAGKQDMHSNYESVTDQAGIYAGKDGYDITVEGNTALKGAVIDSEAPAEKNTLTTGTLTWEDMENKADYKASGSGINVSKGFGSDKAGNKANDQLPLNQKGITPSIAPTVKGDASSTTKAGVSAGTITITDKEHQKQNLDSLNRDTKNSLNKLQEIFDKTKVEERQELMGIVAQEANGMIHDLAESKGWATGSKEKTLLHTLVGGILSEMGGSGFTSGALSGGVNEYVMGVLEKEKGTQWMMEHADMVQWASTIVGGVVSHAAGSSSSSGAGVSSWAAKWNEYQNYPEIRKQIEDLVKSGGLEKLREGEYALVYGEDKDGKHIAVAIGHNGEAYDVTADAGSIKDDRFTLDSGKRLNAGGSTYTIYHMKPEEYEKDPHGASDPTKAPTIYTTGEYDGNVYGYFYEDANPALAQAAHQFVKDHDAETQEILSNLGTNMVGTAVDEKIKVIPLGSILSTGIDIQNDGDIKKYGIEGARDRVMTDIFANTVLIIVTQGRLGTGTSIGVGVLSNYGLSRVKNYWDPELNDAERKKQDKEYIDKLIKNNID